VYQLMAYYVYILQRQKDGSFYIGHTADLTRRIQRHNQSRSLLTKARAPWKLIYQEELNSRSEASKREHQIKQKKNRAYIEHLVRASRVSHGKVVPLRFTGSLPPEKQTPISAIRDGGLFLLI